MTPEHMNHAQQIVKAFASEYVPKYTRGQSEHGGRLWEKGLLFHAQEARAEALDAIAYSHEVMVKVRMIGKIVEEGLHPHTPDFAAKAYLRDIQDVLLGRPQADEVRTGMEFPG